MEESLYIAAMTGDTGFLTEARDRKIETGNWDQYLVSKTPQDNNIIHTATLHGHVDFIKNALTLLNFSLLKLICEQNNNGDTPLHIASKKGNMEIVMLLLAIYSKFNLGGTGSRSDHRGEIELAAGGDHKEILPNSMTDPNSSHILKVQNRHGNTPLHEALIYAKMEVARYLIELDDHVTAGLVNKHKETPLHLAIKHCVKDEKQTVMETIELINRQSASLTYKASKCATKEESLRIIQSLINKSSVQVHYMRDEDGLTPLLRAATVSHLPAIQSILNKFSQTAEIRDFDGQTILHLVKIESYEDAKILMEIPSVTCLKDERDDLGNTPAIVAVKDIIEKIKSKVDFEAGLFKALLVSSANFAIKNKMGVSAVALIKQHKNMFSNIQKERRLNKELNNGDPDTISKKISKIIDAIRSGDENYQIERIHMLGDNLLHNIGCLGGGNILHGVLKAWKIDDKNMVIKIDHGDNNNKSQLLDFVTRVLDKYPTLLYQVDLNGDTILHIIVREHGITQQFLDQIMRYFERYKEDITSYDEEVYFSPWEVKNVEGNTPFHEALLHSPNFGDITSFMLRNNYTSIFALKNHKDETPLHVLCRRPGDDLRRYNQVRDEDEKITEKVLNAYKDAAYIRDADGLTPVIRASQTGNINEAQVICKICPESAKLRDNKGQTFWHVINLSKVSRTNEKYSMEGLLENKEIKELLLYEKDNDGNTAVKLAFKLRNIHLIKALKPDPEAFGEVRKALMNECDMETQYLLMPVMNCATNIILPRVIEEVAWDTLKEMPEKSIFGVLESEIVEYTQTVGLIAVLLATIAFTAAFTVPGGFRQNHEYLNQNDTSVPFVVTSSGLPDTPNITSDLIGTPVLVGTHLIPTLTRLAYWVFMVSDILTMCLSTFVLYCLHWIMKSTHMKMVLIDMSIFFIRVCFYTTMTTFMMGVFATTLQVEPSLAYIALGACSFLMLLMNRWLYPVKTIFLLSAMGIEVGVGVLKRLCNCRFLMFLSS